MKFKKKKLFISFEGPEASGKSTQIKLLKKFLYKKKIKHHVTREPGGTIFAEKLRNIILNKKYKISPSEEILLLMAARSNHIKNIIKPSLIQKKVVITDRFADSTFVYQGYVNKYGLKETINLHKILLDNFMPDITFLFILPPSEINKRLKNRKKTNKYDKINSSFHKKVIEGYEKISKNNKRFIVIDGLENVNIIHEKIVNLLKNFI